MGRIVTGQRVRSATFESARELRRQMTPEEKILWNHLRANRLQGFHFRRQQIIDKYVVDFYCHAANLVVEVDGGIHALQRERDAERESHLYGLGLMVLHFNNDDINCNMQGVLQHIAQTCRARVTHPL